MKPIDFLRAKAEKGGVVTPKAILEHALEHVGDKERVIVLSFDKDGVVKIGWSHGTLIQTLGIVEAAKIEIINDMYKGEE